MSVPLYFRDQKLFQNTAKVIKAERKEESVWEMILDQTCCYPKGGGQPGDKGLVVGQEFSGKIENVFYESEEKYYIVHKVIINQGEPKEGDEVEIIVDQWQRALHSRLHSAGHVIDAAVDELGLFKELEPIKGSHYPDLTYVVYQSKEKKDCKMLQEMFQKTIDQIMQKNLWIFVEFENDDSSNTKCTRFITVEGYTKAPCGGTHVENLSEIGQITIGKVVQKKQEIKVSYKINLK